MLPHVLLESVQQPPSPENELCFILCPPGGNFCSPPELGLAAGGAAASSAAQGRGEGSLLGRPAGTGECTDPKGRCKKFWLSEFVEM